ncbi:MAG TPA: helix-turn-helix domain-containing protein [Candidatus Dormibacteraeota bacterium]|jgi:DNA-binding PucR family transcriptional regulator|nr:helix-turn-helix domain-containing protein [Candidatus Dormibacteraeota bacterium]
MTAHAGPPDRWLDWLDRGLAGQPGAEAMVRDVLGPLLDYDARHHGDLVRTVEVLAATGWSASLAARRLFLLRNSVLYRRSRIEEITGRSLRDPRQRLLLTLAIRLHRHVQHHPE